MSALITPQPEEVRQRIRAAFDRLVAGYRRGDVLELPVAVKLATARKPQRRTPRRRVVGVRRRRNRDR